MPLKPDPVGGTLHKPSAEKEEGCPASDIHCFPKLKKANTQQGFEVWTTVQAASGAAHGITATLHMAFLSAQLGEKHRIYLRLPS